MGTAAGVTLLFCSPASLLPAQLGDTHPGDAAGVQGELWGPPYSRAGMWHAEG